MYAEWTRLPQLFGQVHFLYRGVWFLISLCYEGISEFNVNCVDPVQMPNSAASDLGLRCLPVFLIWTLGINGLKHQAKILADIVLIFSSIYKRK